VCHEQHRGLGHGRARLDECLDAAPGADELRKVLEIGTVDRPTRHPLRRDPPTKPGH